MVFDRPVNTPEAVCGPVPCLAKRDMKPVIPGAAPVILSAAKDLIGRTRRMSWFGQLSVDRRLTYFVY
jgi:hypothetical protein